ncbi:MAG: hypothetical protein JJ971_09920 [Balneolaceae bacterium]|nr:hypothetical protein [Balneolaceae bacterium]MBO6546437.1 hypothetical protein [Balneolaceae bacterium]MBO6648796.1 hypothetical protein [Balneolaceae bacterium]
MRNFKLLTIWGLALVLITGCEVPKKPDFTTSHTLEAPILINKEFQFLGGGGSVEVLIDTTKSEFDSLFTLDPTNSLISISKEEDFDFGDLNDAIPEISTDETSFNSQVGELELGSFSSSEGNLGEANFEALTGIGAGTVSAGDPVPPQVISPSVTIDLDTDFFESATFKSGSLDIVLENNLGYNLDNISITLISDPDPNVGGDEIDLVNDGTGALADDNQATVSLPFSNGDQLANPQVRVSIAWTSSVNPASPDYQEFQRSPVSLVVVSAEGNNLIASQVTAALEGQDFSTSNTTSFDATEFVFSDPSHYVELESGIINIDPIVNGLDLTIDSLIISFPNIRRGPNFLPGDSLRIRYIPGFDQILRSSTSPAKERDLAGFRLYALNNEIEYNIYAVTENTQDAAPGDQTRVINENDEISSSVSIENLRIAEAFGEIVAQNVILGDDDPSNGTDVLDLFNETEAEIIEIDGLEDLSSQISGLEFTQASLSINYESNIGVPTTIYGAFLGVNGDGEEVYLSGKEGGNAEVLPGDPIGGLNVNGAQIPADSLIKFELETSNSGLQMFSLVFDSTNSTVNEFLNNLPSEIRFIGKAVVNEDGTEATISTPLDFDPAFSIDLPLAFRTTEETIFTDTTETTDLQDLPTPEDEANFSEGLLVLSYENGLPLGFSLSLTFLDENGAVVTTLPQDAPTGGQYDLTGAIVNEITRFAETPSSGSIQIALTDGQLSELYRTASIIIESNLRTSQNEEVKFKATDSIKLSVSAKISIQNTVN